MEDIVQCMTERSRIGIHHDPSRRSLLEMEGGSALRAEATRHVLEKRTQIDRPAQGVPVRTPVVEDHQHILYRRPEPLRLPADHLEPRPALIFRFFVAQQQHLVIRLDVGERRAQVVRKPDCQEPSEPFPLPMLQNRKEQPDGKQRHRQPAE